ncbi:MAG: CocE/NonD family hydrolase [Acidimicrobiia bacterium]
MTRCLRAALAIAALASATLLVPIGSTGGSANAAAVTSTTPVAQGSVEQVALTGAAADTAAQLIDGAGKKVASDRTDRTGALLFRSVKPGSGYVVAVGDARTAPVTVTSVTDPPGPNLYSSQTIGDGYGYLRTRDGTLLSINVKLPGPASSGPYPTVVEYSGYDPSNPDGQAPASTIARLFGFATVGVNVRGTGCSGGAWDYFEPLQSLDGYDAIETIAAQPWVSHHAVGMVGVSYPGITQLFVAGTRPPHLAAITPLSAIDDTRNTLYPGGIFNNGFGEQWAKDRSADAKPRASEWARARINDGDTTCQRNQALRLQAPTIAERLPDYEFAPIDPPTSVTGVTDGTAAPAPVAFAHDIDVPVFLAGSWQDEETGPTFVHLLDALSAGTPVKAVVQNGIHADSLSPEVVPRWLEFLDFYVAREVPTITPAQRLLAGVLLRQVYGSSFTIPPDRFDSSASYASQLARYEAEPMVWARFDVGGTDHGAPVAAFDTEVDAWPATNTTATTWYLGDDASLTEAKPSDATTASYQYDPAAFPPTMRTAAAGNAATLGTAPRYVWKVAPKGKAIVFDTSRLTADTVMLGTGSADLWLRSNVNDVDLQVTVSEVRPDGKETYVQSGWLRASRRALDDEQSTALAPVPTYLETDVTPLPKNRAVLVRVPIQPFGHAFRAGSIVRITVQAPGGNRPQWAFDALTYDRKVTNTITLGGAKASKVVLPVLPGVDVPTPLPACGTLRGQPCRSAEPST